MHLTRKLSIDMQVSDVLTENHAILPDVFLSTGPRKPNDPLLFVMRDLFLTFQKQIAVGANIHHLNRDIQSQTFARLEIAL